MSAYARVSRDALYEVAPRISKDHVDTDVTQVKARRPKQRGRKWKKVSIDHLSDLDLAAQDTIGDNRKPEVNSEAPSAAAPSLLPLPHPQTSTPPSNLQSSSTIPSPTGNVKQPSKSKSSRKKRSQKKKTSKMTANPDGTYVLPHLRRKKAVDNPQNVPPSTPTGQGLIVEVSTASTRPATAATVPKRPLSPPSPPTSSDHHQEKHSSGVKPANPITSTVEEKRNISGGEWNEPPLDAPNKPTTSVRGRSNGQSKWNNNKQTNWPKAPRRPPKSAAWPKNRDMRPQPVEESEGGCDLKSNSDGDPDYDIKKLIDWEGKWLPPGDWTGRKHFADRHFGDRIELWAQSIPAAVEAAEIIISHIPNFVSETNSAIAPTWWIPIKVENEASNAFWSTVALRAPPPVDEGDVSGSPWWDTYADETKHLLRPITVPDARIDPKDTDNQSPGARVNATQVIARKLRSEQARKERIMAKRNRPIQDVVITPADTAHAFFAPPLAPAIHLYLRPVRASDVNQITAIYNHYVEHTILANEFTPRTPSQMLDRINDIVERGLPWIVAIAKAGQSSKQGGYVTENLVGFADMDDFCDQGSMYRYTFEMEMYVHHECLGKGVGSCMMDKMLSMVATGHYQRGGYEWRPAENYLKFGSSRVTKLVNISYPHEHYDGTARPEDLQKFFKFMERYNFKHNGRLRKVGYKYGKVVDASIYQYETTETIQADQIPTIPL